MTLEYLVIVTQILYNGCNRNIFEVMTSTLPIGTIVSVASLLAASSIKDILMGAKSSIYIYAAGMLLDINGNFTMEKLKSSLCRKVPFLTATHCLFSSCRSRYEAD